MCLHAHKRRILTLKLDFKNFNNKKKINKNIVFENNNKHTLKVHPKKRENFRGKKFLKNVFQHTHIQGDKCGQCQVNEKEKRGKKIRVQMTSEREKRKAR